MNFDVSPAEWLSSLSSHAISPDQGTTADDVLGKSMEGEWSPIGCNESDTHFSAASSGVFNSSATQGKSTKSQATGQQLKMPLFSLPKSSKRPSRDVPPQKTSAGLKQQYERRLSAKGGKSPLSERLESLTSSRDTPGFRAGTSSSCIVHQGLRELQELDTFFQAADTVRREENERRWTEEEAERNTYEARKELQQRRRRQRQLGAEKATVGSSSLALTCGIKGYSQPLFVPVPQPGADLLFARREAKFRTCGGVFHQ